MITKATFLHNQDLWNSAWEIRADAWIIEMHCDQNSRKALRAKLSVACWLDPNMFRIITPNQQDQLKDYVCFEYTNRYGDCSIVYVHESDIILKQA